MITKSPEIVIPSTVTEHDLIGIPAKRSKNTCDQSKLKPQLEGKNCLTAIPRSSNSFNQFASLPSLGQLGRAMNQIFALLYLDNF